MAIIAKIMCDPEKTERKSNPARTSPAVMKERAPRCVGALGAIAGVSATAGQFLTDSFWHRSYISMTATLGRNAEL
jgi:hypothetical protein